MLDNIDMIYILVHLICGFEWHLISYWFSSQIDLTWWFTWYDLESKNWKSDHTQIQLFSGDSESNDYYDFYNAFSGDGFSLVINLAEGGAFPGTQDVLIDGQPQHLVVKSAIVYGFY